MCLVEKCYQNYQNIFEIKINCAVDQTKPAFRFFHQDVVTDRVINGLDSTLNILFNGHLHMLGLHQVGLYDNFQI